MSSPFSGSHRGRFDVINRRQVEMIVNNNRMENETTSIHSHPSLHHGYPNLSNQTNIQTSHQPPSTLTIPSKHSHPHLQPPTPSRRRLLHRDRSQSTLNPLPNPLKQGRFKIPRDLKLRPRCKLVHLLHANTQCPARRFPPSLGPNHSYLAPGTGPVCDHPRR
jgi:hypothetical protein